MIQVNVHEAKTNLSRLLEKSHRGEEIIVAKADTPYARLGSLEFVAEKVPGRYNDAIDTEFFDPLPVEEVSAWEA